MRKKRSTGSPSWNSSANEYDMYDERIEETENEAEEDFELDEEYLESDELDVEGIEDDEETDDEYSEEADDETDAEIEDEAPDEDLSNFQSSVSSRNTNSLRSEQGILTIINSKKNGKRITLSQELEQKLNYPESVKFSFSQNEIAIAADLPGNQNGFRVIESGTKGIIYSAGLVKEITDKFQLDFSNRVSITLHEVRYVRNGSNKVAVVKVF